MPRKATPPEYQFDVALSFAGEDRALVDTVASYLRDCDVRVFYDEYFRDDLWGKDLFQHLAGIYRDKARFCLVFVSKAYRDKAWPKHELRQAQERALFSATEYILPVLLDDVELPGLNRTTGYLDGRTTHPWTIGGLVMRKLGLFDVTPIDRSEVARIKHLSRPKRARAKFGGTEMVNYWPSRIREAQPLKHMTYQATVRRIRYGDEFAPRYRMKKNCRSCGVRWGQIHVPGCSVEICPLCAGQLLSCDCPIEQYTSKPFEIELLTGQDQTSKPPKAVAPERFGPRFEWPKSRKVRRRP